MDRKKTTEFLGNLLVSDRFGGGNGKILGEGSQHRSMGGQRKT